MSMQYRSLPCHRFAWRQLLGTLGTAAVAFAASPLSAQQQYTDIRRLGTANAISRPGPDTREELQQVFERNRDAYLKVLQDVGWPGNPEDVFQAVRDGQFSEAQYPVGHTFEWMAVRKGGVPQPTGPVRWAGEAPFEAFEIRVESNDRAYRFLIPKACGNLALVGEGPTEAQIERERQEQQLRELLPAIRIQAPAMCTGANVTVDVTLPGQMPEGGRLQLTMTRPNGERQTLEATQAGGGYRWQGQLDDAGAYTFTAVVESPIGRSREATERITLDPCEPTCNIQLTPPPADPTPRRGRASVTIDMCQSAARMGELTNRSVQVHHTPADGPEQLIETLALDEQCSTSFVLPEYGAYRFEGTVTDDRGMSSTCQADYTLAQPESRIEPFFTAFGGKERRVRDLDPITGEPVDDDVAGSVLGGRCAPLFGATVGVAFPFAEGGASFFGQGGVAVNVRDTENTSLFADVGIDRNFEGGFIGGGVGVWDFTHSDTVDGSVFVHGGFDISERLQWKFEGRLFMSELDQIENNYAVFAGIRYFWRR